VQTLPLRVRFIMTLTMALFLWGLGGRFSAAQAAETSSPAALVRAFQADYLHWNNQLLAIKENQTSDSVMSAAVKTYSEMLTKYTLPDFVGEPVAFGSESLHDPAKEKILTVKTHGGTAVVTTEFPGEYYTPTYEYHLVYQQHRWYLTAVDLVDEDGKFPSL